jgi:divalent metal cation (Fe/Co/Zn/Cd) transporter
MWVDLDLEVDPGLSFEHAHEQATNLKFRLLAELATAAAATPVAEINVHIEPYAEGSVVGAPLDPVQASSYIERVKEIGQELKQTGGCHDIELHKINSKIYLSLHLLINSGIPIAEVHNIAEEMENRLRREYPELGRVVIHTEPQSFDGEQSAAGRGLQ